MFLKRTLVVLLATAPGFAYCEEGYPTLDRVNYVLDCMDRHGGQSIDNLVSCSCELDKVAAKLSYEGFIDANVYMQNKDIPGDKGAMMRDAQFAIDNYETLMDVRTDAEKSCFIRARTVERKPEAAAGGAEAVPAAASPSAESAGEAAASAKPQ
jgi:hypothetical protein